MSKQENKAKAKKQKPNVFLDRFSWPRKWICVGRGQTVIIRQDGRIQKHFKHRGATTGWRARCKFSEAIAIQDYTRWWEENDDS